MLGTFYDHAVPATAAGSPSTQRQIRHWVERALITPGGTRAAAYAGPTETAGIPNSVVAALERSRLIRAEWRAGARWYELTHDRLIEPIQQANAREAAARQARLWRIGAIVAAALAAGAMAATFAILSRSEPPARGAISAVFVAGPRVAQQDVEADANVRIGSRSGTTLLAVIQTAASAHSLASAKRELVPNTAQSVAFHFKLPADSGLYRVRFKLRASRRASC